MHIQQSTEDECKRFEICRRKQKLKIKYLDNCVFRCFMLYNYITMHVANNDKKNLI